MGSGTVWYWTEACATGGAGAAAVAAWRGDAAAAAALASHLSARVIAERCHAEQALRAGK